MIDNCHNCGGALVEQRRALSQCDGCGDHVVSAGFIAACNPMVEKLKAERDQLRAEAAALRDALTVLCHWAERFETAPQGVGQDAVERALASARRVCSRVLESPSAGSDLLERLRLAEAVVEAATEVSLRYGWDMFAPNGDVKKLVAAISAALAKGGAK